MLSCAELIDAIRSYNPNCNIDLVSRAYNMCKHWHRGQYRKSGDQYYTHPVEVAEEIIKMQLDDVTIVTALLHDVLEDTDATYDDIKNQFSEEIANLVDGVTKLDKINFQIEQVKQAENLRKLFIALSKDVRVLVVKLCDRLHNMKTLAHQIKKDKIRRIAIETLEIYAPLAERIGMDDVCRQLQDLSFGFINPRARNSVLKRLEKIKTKSGSDNVISTIIKDIESLLFGHNIKSIVRGREKTPYSIWKKMISKGVGFEKLSDIMGFRIIVDNIFNCYSVLGIIHTFYKAVPNTFADYVSIPKQNGYSSIHTAVIGPLNQRIEIQIRTKEMDIDAEYGFASHWSYKLGPRDDHRIEKGMESWVSKILEILKDTSSAQEFLEVTKLEMYEEQIFAFTPNGDIVNLPRGATILDFAFASYGGLGCFCSGAKIDNKIVGVDHKIKNGDQVDIMVSKSTRPSSEFLKFVKTAKAKFAIKKSIDSGVDFTFEKGKDILERLMKKNNKKLDDKTIEKILNTANIKSFKDLCAAICNQEINILKILKSIFLDLLHVDQIPSGPSEIGDQVRKISSGYNSMV